jgi:hypothetical protein
LGLVHILVLLELRDHGPHLVLVRLTFLDR